MILYVEKIRSYSYTEYMNNFSKGVNTIGQLLPSPIPFSSYPPPNSQWQGVADSFRQAGDSLRAAIKEVSNAQRESEQAQ